MEKKIRIGVIGCGSRGSGLITESIAHVSTMELTAICDLIPKRMERVLDKLKEKEYRSRRYAFPAHLKEYPCKYGERPLPPSHESSEDHHLTPY